ncbi:NAD-dependent epimerase/dehydratase family protein [Streptomyces sp. NPDC058308]|uniref:NAD-dependent epimerase/dehydratase family protein n=1 Tax=Streptomyces sp. NPDC058308 TaxID=3346440 RepID=UPI0036EF0BC0
MRVFVTGATGYIGGSVADLLLRSGHQVEGLVRTEDKTRELKRRGITPVLGTLDDSALLTARARAADAVVNAADSDHRGAVEALVEGLADTGRALVHTSGSSIVSTDSRGAVADEVFTEEIAAPGASWRPIEEKADRVALDRFVLDAADRGVRSVVLCNSLVYGHGRGTARDSVQIPVLARQARENGVVRYVEEGRTGFPAVPPGRLSLRHRAVRPGRRPTGAPRRADRQGRTHRCARPPPVHPQRGPGRRRGPRRSRPRHPSSRPPQHPGGHGDVELGVGARCDLHDDVDSAPPATSTVPGAIRPGPPS